MLVLESVETGYDAGQVLFGVSLEVSAGQCVALMGRNGMGKTTTVRSIMGQLPLRHGRITRLGNADTGRSSHEIARDGIGLVPEGRQIFGNLSVLENLRSFYRPPTDPASRNHWQLETVLALFPQLQQRLHHGGNQLSGGEQQMLAIGRALMTNPKLLILDEATEGLAPIIRSQIWACLERLKQQDLAILIIDKSVVALSRLADFIYILENGRVVWQGEASALNDPASSARRFLNL